MSGASGRDAVVAESASRRPSGPLRPLVARYVGYRYSGFPPGIHLGLPSRHLTVVIALGPPTCLAGMPDPAQPPAEFQSLASGLATRPARIAHDGSQYGVQLDLTPAGARALLGVPPAALGPSVVALPELLGRAVDELVDRMADASGWAARFAALDEVLTRRVGALGPTAPALARAWDRLVRSGGTVRVADVAEEVGWSRRHLSERFTREFGLGPKELARVVRFERSKALIDRQAFPTLADVAAECGYYDQAHLTREWTELAGCPPSAWLAGEELPKIQDAGGGPGQAERP